MNLQSHLPGQGIHHSPPISQGYPEIRPRCRGLLPESTTDVITSSRAARRMFWINGILICANFRLESSDYSSLSLRVRIFFPSSRRYSTLVHRPRISFKPMSSFSSSSSRGFNGTPALLHTSSTVPSFSE